MLSVKFGVLGTGAWATATHAAALARHPEVELVGVWGRDRAKAGHLAERYGTMGIDDPDELFKRADAVAIALPPDIQAPLAARAARAGCHLLLDKPLALDVGAADEVVAAATASGVSSVVFFPDRFAPERAGWIANAAEEGDWDGASVLHLASISEDAWAASPWRRRWGALWDVAPHALGVLLPVLGPVERAVAGRGRADFTHLLLEHQNGGLSTVTVTLRAAPEAATREVVVWGPHGSTTMPSATTGPLDAMNRAISELLAGIAEGRSDHPCDVRFGRDVVAGLSAAQAWLDRPAGQRSQPVAMRPVKG